MISNSSLFFRLEIFALLCARWMIIHLLAVPIMGVISRLFLTQLKLVTISVFSCHLSNRVRDGFCGADRDECMLLKNH